MWAEKPVFSHLWAKSEFNEILVWWLIKLIFAWMCLSLSSPHIFNELNVLYHWLHNTQNVQMSTMETQPREIPTNIYLWILWETRGSFISSYKLHWSDKNPPPEKSFHTKCLHIASVMYRGRVVSVKRGLHSSTATCFRLAVDIQLFSKTKESLF